MDWCNRGDGDDEVGGEGDCKKEVEEEEDLARDRFQSTQLSRITKDTKLTYQPRLLGFLSGSVLAAGGMYFYVLQEYRVSNELLTEDIYVCFTVPTPLLYLAMKEKRNGTVLIGSLYSTSKPPSRE